MDGIPYFRGSSRAALPIARLRTGLQHRDDGGQGELVESSLLSGNLRSWAQ